MAPKRQPQPTAPKAAAPSPTAAAKPKPPPPRPLTPRARLLLLLLLPLSIAGFCVGCAGMLVLMDLPLLAGSAFATAWRALLAKNLFFQPFFFNFGAIASIACVARLVEGRRAALLLEAAAAAESKRR